MISLIQKTVKKISYFILAVIFVSFLLKSVFACTCSLGNIPPCVAFERSDVVFIGKLQSQSDLLNNSKFPPTVTGYFEIQKTFKGNPSDKVKLRIPSGDCGYSFREGEIYFIYAYKNAEDGVLEIKRCDRSRHISKAGSDIEYVKSLDSPSPFQSIMGEILGLSPEDLEKTKVTVNSDNETITDQINKDGFFNLKPKYTGQFRIVIDFPLKLEISITGNPDVQIEERGSRTLLTYNVFLAKNKCSYRMFFGKKQDKTTKASIKGKLADENGNPIPKIEVYLYPNTDRQDFQENDYKLAKTDNDGNFLFNQLRLGEYFVGLNLGRTPELNTPYPQLFFSDNKVSVERKEVEFNGNQNLDLGILRLPPKLVKRQITGKLFWGDGSPVTRKDPSTEASPIFYLVDPISYKLISSFNENGERTKEIDDEGNFSFLVYEGYEYIIHAHAFDANNQPFHSKHFKVKITNDLSPFELKLSIAGVGDDEKTIKQEIIE